MDDIIEDFGVIRQSLTIRKGDITELEVDCIVNAANSNLRMGGGVCGAIFRKAGAKELMEACAKYGSCKPGFAVCTPAFKLKAKCIAHAVGPVWHGGINDESALLESCYKNVLSQAKEMGCTSFAFPLISAGSYGFPVEEAWRIALRTILNYQKFHQKDPLEVIFAVIDDGMLALGNSILESLLRE